MNPFDMAYMQVAHDILLEGEPKSDRTGVGTVSVFGKQLRASLMGGQIPLFTCRDVPYRSFIHEMLWFISGSTDIEYLKRNNVSIWDSWVLEDTKRFDDAGKLTGGSIGPGAYGSQWRDWNDTRVVDRSEEAAHIKRGFTSLGKLGHSDVVVRRRIDQLQNCIDQLRTNPDSRRIIMMAYNPAAVDDCALPPCHSLVQFWTREMTVSEIINKLTPDEYTKFQDWMTFRVPSAVDTMNEDAMAWFRDNGVKTRALSIHLFCRSQDFLLGSVFNIAQYGLLAHMVAQCANMVAEELVWTGSDVHIYKDQIDIFNETLGTDPESYSLPTLKLNPTITEINDFEFSDIEIIDYVGGPKVTFPVAV